MSVAARSPNGAAPAEGAAPHDLGDDVLMERLALVQSQAREIMREFNIASSNVSVMAWQAEQAIADTAVRAAFLRQLIDLHEYGRQARQRGLLAHPGDKKPSAPTAAPVPTVRNTNLFASDEEAADTVSTDTTRAYFAFLDR